jgi:hypothetical protein
MSQSKNSKQHFDKPEQTEANESVQQCLLEFSKVKYQTSTKLQTNFSRFLTTWRSLRWLEVTTSSIWKTEQFPSTKDHRVPCPNPVWKNWRQNLNFSWAWEVVRTIPTGCRHFATYDAFKGYHQVELNPESRKLTTFHTPFGRYRYVSMAMGLSSAGDIFTTRYGDAFDYTIEILRCTEDTLIHSHTSDKLARKIREFIAACSEACMSRRLSPTNRK